MFQAFLEDRLRLGREGLQAWPAPAPTAPGPAHDDGEAELMGRSFPARGGWLAGVAELLGRSGLPALRVERAPWEGRDRGWWASMILGRRAGKHG